MFFLLSAQKEKKKKEQMHVYVRFQPSCITVHQTALVLINGAQLFIIFFFV